MFEALETGRSLDRDSYRAERDVLRGALLQVQQDLRKRDYPVIIVMGGIDGSGKGAVIHRLNSWMDPRYIDTNAFWLRSEEEESRPYLWRFWRCLPPRGEIGIFLGSWYRRPLHQAAAGELDEAGLQQALLTIEAFERTLTDDGCLLIKIWLHVNRDVQRDNLTIEIPEHQQDARVPLNPEKWWDLYPKALGAAERLIRMSDSGHSPWHLVEANDRRYRDIAAARIVLERMREHAERPPPAPATQVTVAAPDPPGILDQVDLTLSVDRDTYRKRLKAGQKRLQELSWRAHRERRSLVAVFEGWDAAGKGSAIRRITEPMDPRLYKLFQFAAPTDEEQARHYLWRFWRRLQRDGRATFFDRSWYGRVLVERVEGFARLDEWRRAYREINEFERQLVEHGCVVLKFWLHISPEKQLERFRERETSAHKRHKITEEDWRNRRRWPEYAAAVEDMLIHTSSESAPWTLVPADDKLYARLHVLETVCDALEEALAPGPESGRRKKNG